MRPQEASEVCAWLSELFREIGEEQMATIYKRFLMDVYRVEDVKQAASELRPVVNFFDYERFNAIWNRIRQQNVDPEAKRQSAVDELRRDQRRLEEKTLLDRKKEIERRLNELGLEQRAQLAQEAINRLPEELRGLYERITALKEDPFKVASVREEAALILEGK